MKLLSILTLFQSFILFCGVTHLNNWTKPDQDVRKGFVWVTAVISIITAIVLFIIKDQIILTIVNHIKQSDIIRASHEDKLRMMGFVSHELKNQLQVLCGILDVEDIQNDNVKKVTKRLSVMFEDASLLLYSSNNRIELKPETVCFDDFRSELKNMYGEKVSVYWKESQFIQTDKVRVLQVLNNLIDNAIRYSERPVQVVFSLSDNRWHVSVIDQGTGIDPEIQKDLFTPFMSWRRDAFKKTGGSGLGLSIVKSLTTLLGGDVKLLSSDFSGTHFQCSFPFFKVPQNRDYCVLEMEEEKKEKISTIALVDDNRDIVDLLNLIVKRCVPEATIQTFLSGESLVNAVENGYRAEVIFIDFNMGPMNGIDTAQQVINHYRPTLYLLTGELLSPGYDDKLSNLFREVLRKPIGMGKIKELLT